MRPQCVILSPPSYGHDRVLLNLLPRGALNIASFLIDQGIDASVVPVCNVLRPAGVTDVTDPAVVSELTTVLRDADPDVIGIANPFTLNFPETMQLAELCRQIRPQTPILIGGNHVTPLAAACLQGHPAINAVVRGEGEWTFLEAVNRLTAGQTLAGVSGITWRRDDGLIIDNPSRPLGNLQQLPAIDLGLLPQQMLAKTSAHAIVSRGCAYGCSFCAERIFWGGRVRRLPLEHLRLEQQALARSGNSLAGIDDSMVDMRDHYFSDLCDVLEQLDLPANFYVVTRVDALTKDGLTRLRQAGVKCITVGLESVSPKVLRKMNKRLDRDEVLTGLEIAQESGFFVNSFWMFGHPGDDRTEANLTLEWMDQLLSRGLIDCMDVSWFTPLPGTDFFSDPKKHGIRVLSDDYRDWNHYRIGDVGKLPCDLETFSAEEIYGAYVQAMQLLEKHLTVRMIVSTRPQVTEQPTIMNLNCCELRFSDDRQCVLKIATAIANRGAPRIIAAFRGNFAAVIAPFAGAQLPVTGAWTVDTLQRPNSTEIVIEFADPPPATMLQRLISKLREDQQ